MWGIQHNYFQSHFVVVRAQQGYSVVLRRLMLDFFINLTCNLLDVLCEGLRSGIIS